MKSSLQQHLGVMFESFDTSEISKVIFMFRQVNNMHGIVKKQEMYDPEDEEATVELNDGYFLVPFSVEDSYLFKQNKPFYMDTKIFLSDSDDNPETEIVELYNNNTLIRKEEAYG